MSSDIPRVAALVLAHDRPDKVAATLDAVQRQEPAPEALILVDNDGTPEVTEALRRAADAHPDVEIVRLDENLGSAGGFAAGLERVMARDDIGLVCGFDDDATPLPGCIAALRTAATTLPDVGSVGALSHDAAGTLAWPMYVDGEREPARTVQDVRELARRRPSLPVHNHSWHGLMIPVENLRRHGNVWVELFLQFEDMELGIRLRRAGLHNYLVPGAEVVHPPPPPARELRILGRNVEITAQSAAKEYLTLRNGLVVRHRYDGARFWYGTGPFTLLRGVLSALALDAPRYTVLREVFFRGVTDAVRGRLGPPPTATRSLGPRRG